MSTRAIIAREVNARLGKFEGRYHHSDGYPSGLGATLHDLYNGHFNKDIDAMLKYLIDDHPAGWSSINGADFNLQPGFVEGERLSELWKAGKQPAPRCYCHGTRHEEGMLLTESDDTDTVWAYVFLKDRPAMQILKPIHDNEYTVIGWEPVQEVSLEKSVDWDRVECGEHFERCGHVEGYHKHKAA